jgi:hypothetical protein
MRAQCEIWFYQHLSQPNIWRAKVGIDYYLSNYHRQLQVLHPRHCYSPDRHMQYPPQLLVLAFLRRWMLLHFRALLSLLSPVE